MHTLVYNQFFTKHILSVLTIFNYHMYCISATEVLFLSKINDETLQIVLHCEIIRGLTTIIISE